MIPLDEALMDIASLTQSQPFYAGVSLQKGRRFLLTLKSDGDSGIAEGDRVAGRRSWRRAGAGETVWDCTLREAKEGNPCRCGACSPSPVDLFSQHEYRRTSANSGLVTPSRRWSSAGLSTPVRIGPMRPGFRRVPSSTLRCSGWDPIRPGDDVRDFLSVPSTAGPNRKRGSN